MPKKRINVLTQMRLEHAMLKASADTRLHLYKQRNDEAAAAARMSAHCALLRYPELRG